jgi:integrase/recombinase XerD
MGETPVFDEKIERFRRRLKIGNKSEHTLLSYLGFVNDFREFTRKDLNFLSKDDVEDYFFHLSEDREMKPTSIRLARMALKQFFDTVGLDLIDHIPSPKVGRRLPKFLTREEVSNLISSCKKVRDQAITHLLYCGLRVGEVVTLQHGDLDLENRKVRVRGKGDKHRFPRLSNAAVESLRLYLSESQRDTLPPQEHIFDITTRRIQQFVERAAKKAGIERSKYPLYTTVAWSFKPEHNRDLHKRS